MSDTKAKKGELGDTGPSYTVATIASLLMLTERRVQQLASENVIPKSGKGRYPLVTAVQGYIRYLQERDLPTDGDEDGYDAARTRLTNARADTAEMERDLMRGRVVAASDAEEIVEEEYAAVRDTLSQIAPKCASRVYNLRSASEAQEIIEAEIAEALHNLTADTDDGRDYRVRARTGTGEAEPAAEAEGGEAANPEAAA